MKRKYFFWPILGFIITSLIGTLLHFLYEWTKSILVAPFSCINESTWEHMKIVFWPMFIFAIIQSLFLKHREDFWNIKLKTILIGIILIPLIYYTYNGVIGPSPDWINISIFFISVAIAYFCEYKLLINEDSDKNNLIPPMVILYFILILFVIFTFITPTLAIFMDPLTKTYGLNVLSL